MAKLIFDKGLETERELEIDNYFEHPIKNQMSAGKSVEVKEGADYPSLDGFTGGDTFFTLRAETDEGQEIPLNGDYNKIEDLSVNYYDADRIWSVSISLSNIAEDAE